MLTKPNSREAALLLLHAVEKGGDRRGKGLTRARVSRVSLKRLWLRENLTEPWIAEVNEWLLSAGWTLLYAGGTFGIVKTTVVEHWPRVSSKHVQEAIDQAARGDFNFGELEHLWAARTEEPANRKSGRLRKTRVKE